MIGIRGSRYTPIRLSTTFTLSLLNCALFRVDEASKLLPLEVLILRGLRSFQFCVLPVLILKGLTRWGFGEDHGSPDGVGINSDPPLLTEASRCGREKFGAHRRRLAGVTGIRERRRGWLGCV